MALRKFLGTKKKAAVAISLILTLTACSGIFIRKNFERIVSFSSKEHIDLLHEGYLAMMDIMELTEAMHAIPPSPEEYLQKKVMLAQAFANLDSHGAFFRKVSLEGKAEALEVVEILEQIDQIRVRQGEGHSLDIHNDKNIASLLHGADELMVSFLKVSVLIRSLPSRRRTTS